MKHLKTFENYIFESVGITDQEINRIKTELSKYPTLNGFIGSLDKLFILYRRQGMVASDLRPGVRDLFEITEKDKSAPYAFIMVVGKNGDVPSEVLSFFQEWDNYLKSSGDLMGWANNVLFNFDLFYKETFKKILNIDQFKSEASKLFQ